MPVNIALQRQKLPVAVALHWEAEADHAAIHGALATICRWFDVAWMTVGGTLIALPEILVAELELDTPISSAL